MTEKSLGESVFFQSQTAEQQLHAASNDVSDVWLVLYVVKLWTVCWPVACGSASDYLLSNTCPFHVDKVLLPPSYRLYFLSNAAESDNPYVTVFVKIFQAWPILCVETDVVILWFISWGFVNSENRPENDGTSILCFSFLAVFISFLHNTECQDINITKAKNEASVFH